MGGGIAQHILHLRWESLASCPGRLTPGERAPRTDTRGKNISSIFRETRPNE